MKHAVLVCLLSALPMFAQPPRGFFAWWDTPLARDVNLSEDQQRQIRQTLREYRSRLVDLRATVEKAEIEVEDAFNDDSISAQRASEAIERLATSRAELTRAFSQMSLRLRSVLTAEQWRELQKRRPGLLQQRLQQRLQQNQPQPRNIPPN